MSKLFKLKPKSVTAFAVTCAFLIVQFSLSITHSYGSEPKPALSQEEQIRLGERMYREGILPSGEPMQAFIKGDISVQGTSFTCGSCHLRSGLGSVEGGVFTPPTTGKELYKPLDMIYKNVEADKKIFTPILFRPAYTDTTLAAVLSSGVGPSGKTLNPVMPRYHLEDGDMALLITYLKSLSKDLSPGVTDSELHFATVITDDVRPEEYEAMLAPLEQYISHKNNMIKLYKKDKRSERMAATMVQSAELLYKKLSLSRWILKGPPETWRSQLDEYYRKEPVFALLGGISNGSWKPVHEFSEANHIPCLFPQTNYPVISDTDWYTLYFSKGYYQEGETAAHYLHDRSEAIKAGNIVQIVRADNQAEAYSESFQRTWHELGHNAPFTYVLKPGETLTWEAVQKLLQKQHPAALLLWDDSRALPVLEMLAGEKNRPDIVLLAGSALGSSLWNINEQARDFTYITYPKRLPQDEERFKVHISLFKNNPKYKTADDEILKRSFITTQMLTYSLMDMRGNYYRDNFFDVIGMMPDQYFPLFERISFGPGQRYASKGCFIVQLGKGPKPQLVKKSDWVIH